MSNNVYNCLANFLAYDLRNFLKNNDELESENIIQKKNFYLYSLIGQIFCFFIKYFENIFCNI